VSKYSSTVNEHYGPIDISKRILEKLQSIGVDVDNLSRDDLAPFDEFHSGGRLSTRNLARFAELRPGMKVLDVGSGIGGPARTLAAEFECDVTGLDLTMEYCRAARILTDKVGLREKVRFLCGNALEMPFADESFDIVWSQNTLMNIDNKTQLFREIHRILRPNSIFVFEAILAGRAPDLHFPVFWADSPSLSFLTTPSDLKRLLESLSLHESVWEDTTAQTIINQKNRRETINHGDKPMLDLGVIVTKDLHLKMQNVLRNNEESRTVTVRAIYQKPRKQQH